MSCIRAPTLSTSHSTVSAETSVIRFTSSGSSVSPAIRIKSWKNVSGSSFIPASRWKRLPAPGTEPVDRAELPPGRSVFSTMATSKPASAPAMAAARPQAPAPMTRRSISSLMTAVRIYRKAFPERDHAIAFKASINSLVDMTSAYFDPMSKRLTKCDVRERSYTASSGTATRKL